MTAMFITAVVMAVVVGVLIAFGFMWLIDRISGRHKLLRGVDAADIHVVQQCRACNSRNVGPYGDEVMLVYCADCHHCEHVSSNAHRGTT